MYGPIQYLIPEREALDCDAATAILRLSTLMFLTPIRQPDYLTPFELCLGLTLRYDGAAVPASSFHFTWRTHPYKGALSHFPMVKNSSLWADSSSPSAITKIRDFRTSGKTGIVTGRASQLRNSSTFFPKSHFGPARP